MQLAAIDPNPCGPERKRPRLLPPIESIPIPALDVQNFPLDWPRWSDGFQVYLATNFHHHLSDEEKLSILLELLGAEGSALASSLYSRQDDIEEDENWEFHVVADTFDEVWWRLNELSDVDLNKNRTRALLDQRRNLLESSVEDIEKVTEINYFTHGN